MTGVLGTFFGEDEIVEASERDPRFYRRRVVRKSERDRHICQRIDLGINNRGTGGETGRTLIYVGP